ncbi:glycosyltransferase family 4 protein [Peptoclostridium acidaminophilum]|uniref:glycosyltransferase family 4 protein n=1 Tax=Peptoclostridium acidaminophilum TaxID=1731 RepID=UPI00046D6E0D|nr:glycosyltransferase family 4 protein [Peptoclostridium acidaminophilum]
MRVLLVNHFPLEGSGSGIYTKNLAMQLVKKGHEVCVIAPDHQEVQMKGCEVRTIIFSDGKNCCYEVDFNFPCFTTHPKSYLTFYELSEFQINRYVDVFEKAMKEAVEEFVPDIIHCQHLWIAPYCASKLGVPYVVTAHGTDIKGFCRDERYHPYALEGAKNAAAVITISKQVDADVEKYYGVESGRRRLILNGFDEEIFRPRDLNRSDVLKSLNLNTDYEYVVSFVGKLTDFKGVDVLIRAAKIYSQEIQNVITLIVGNGEKYDELVKLRDDLDVKNVYFLGHRDQDVVSEIYSIADVSVVPSRNEPFGLVAIEALACGTPVVATNQGGLVDFIDETIGSLVPVEDDIALGEAIEAEILSPSKSERRQRAARKAMEYFSWDRVVDDVVRLYTDVL